MKRGLFLLIVLIYTANAFAQGSLSVFDVDASLGRVFVGSTYTNNVIYARGDISPKFDTLTGNNMLPNGVQVNSSFGVEKVIRKKKGEYEVTLRLANPVTGSSALLSDGIIQCNVIQEFVDSNGGMCHFIFPSELVTVAGRMSLSFVFAIVITVKLKTEDLILS